MTQKADNVIDHEMLFRQPEYTSMFENKQKNFEYKHPKEKVIEIQEWTKTKEYQEKNFARTALTVNPAKACQPLGAVFAAVGFHKTLQASVLAGHPEARWRPLEGNPRVLGVYRFDILR